MGKKLITIEDLILYRPLSKNIPVERIESYIEEAQEIDLRAVLGDSLYYDFMLKFDNTGDAMYTKYQELLKGKVYIANGVTKEYPGIIPMLAHYTLARFYENNAINVTRFGLTAKVTEESTPISDAALAKAVSSIRSVGIAYQNRVEDFLNTVARVDYTLYNSAGVDSQLNNTGVKFFDV
jgi:hypothetical protein